jgi:hypothetical protein
MTEQNEGTSFSSKELKSHLTSSDCAFIIDGEEIRAHKLKLTCCSPVFEKMFYGKLASNRVIITDISLENFSQMLEFIYTNNVRIESVLHAWSLFYIAHKYLLNDFAITCANYIEQNLTINNLVLSYEFAEMYEIVDLQRICMSDIVDYIRGIFLKKCDYHMKPSSLLTILQQKSLNISNDDLVKGILNWAVIECDIKSISLSPENILNLLKFQKILHYLINIDFNVDPNSDNLIRDSSQLIKKLKNPNNPYTSYHKKHWCIFCEYRESYKIASRVELRERDVLISNISVNRNTLLYGLVVVTEDKQIGNKANEHNGVIHVQISEIDNPEVTVETIFCKSFSYETQVYVPLSDVVYLECDKIYSIKIGYKNLDNFNRIGIRKSSVLCNYMSCKLVDERRKTVFSFDELDGSVITGIAYYPA